MRSGRRGPGVVTLAAGLMLAVAACGGGSHSSHKTTTGTATATGTATTATTHAQRTAVAPTTWSAPNATLQNTRAVASAINSSNASKLHVDWRIPLHAAGVFGYYANTPVFDSGGIVYFQDLAYNVFAVDAKTGKVRWRHPSGLGAPSLTRKPIGEGPNGVNVTGGVVYGETPSDAFALSASTGERLWRTPALAEKQGQGFNIAPQVANGTVFLSTSGQLHGGRAYGLNAKTGRVRWSFEETKRPQDRTLGGTDGTGGAWNAPAIGPDGTVYFGIANPYRSINAAIHHPVRLLYNDSTVALTPHGKLKWYYQGVPNDFHDWDMQVSPMYAESDGHGIVVDAGKMGYVYAMDAATGKLLWKRAVGRHNGHDNDGLKALHHRLTNVKTPYRFYPGIYGGVETNMATAGGVVYVPVTDLYGRFPNKKVPIATNGPFPKGTGEMVALSLASGKVLWDTKLPRTPYGDATVTNDLVFTTLFDGRVVALSRASGKIVWQAQLPADTNSSVSIDGNQLITVASYPSGKGQRPQIVAYTIAPGSHTRASSTKTAAGGGGGGGGGGGTVSAAAGKHVFASNCTTCHTLAAADSHGTVGPNLDQLKPSMGLVVHQVTNGGGGMPAFGSKLSSAQIRSVAKYVSSVAGK